MKRLASQDQSVVEIHNPFRVMREDSETHMSDTYIQSGETGRWRTEATADKLALMKEKLGDHIKALGYALSGE